MGRWHIRFGWKLCLTAIFFFILGNLISLFFVPITRTCVLDNTDKEFNIMANSKLENPHLIVLILSAPDNLKKRNRIRETWLNFDTNSAKPRIKHYFVIGKFELKNLDQLRQEQSEHNDILSLPMKDGYNNLTEKVLKSFVWLSEQIEVGFNFKYVLKCDDDSYIRIRDLIHELVHLNIIYLNSNVEDITKIDDNSSPYISVNYQSNQISSQGNRELYWGYFNGNAQVYKTGKWKETSWILCDRYLPYALGGAYVLSKNLVVYLAKNAQHLRYYHSEDVSVGAWLSTVNNIVRIHDTRFDTEYKSRGCQNTHLAMHNLKENEMKKIHDNILSHGYPCKEEIKYRNVYLYKWHLPPSNCCTPAV